MSLQGTQKKFNCEQSELNEESFLKELYLFMKNRSTPIERIPHLGFIQIDLFMMYKTVQSLGGYNQVTAHQLWKQVYNKLGGNPRSTSAATCTRRHYEKLILPYECHLKGEDDKGLIAPPQQKRSCYNTFPYEEEEALRCSKRSMSNRHRNTSLPQESPDFLADTRVRIIPRPLHAREYFNPGHPILPTYLPASPIMLRLPASSHPQVSCLPTSPHPSDWPKQQLVLLRTLAKEYTSSSGWAEPLNLSSKNRGLDHLSHQPSSFAPPRSNKAPRFLNKVSPLYSSCNLAKEEGPEVMEYDADTREPSSAPPFKSVPTQEQQPIDLTITTSCKTLLVSAPTVQTKISSPKSQSCSSSALDIKVIKTQEKSCPQKPKEGAEGAEASKPTLNCSMLRPPKDPPGRMEIQIPLTLLQDWIRGNFGTGPKVKTTFQQPDRGLVLPSELTVQQQETAEAFPNVDIPADLILKDSRRDSRLEHGKKQTSSSTKEIHPFGSHYHANMNSRTKYRDWAPTSDFRGNTKLTQLNMLQEGAVDCDSFQHVHSWCKDYEARRLYHQGQLQVHSGQNLMPGRSQAQAQPGPMWMYGGSFVQELNSASPQSPPYTADTSLSGLQPNVSLGLPEKQSMAMPHKMLMVNQASSSLLPFTIEEYLKLRRLISDSP